MSEQEMLHKAAAYCSASEHCIQEVEKKIYAAGFDTEAAERIIARLLQEKFIDESRFCRFFVNDKLRFNKWGRIKIGYELRKKNIPSQTINLALEEIDEEEYESVLLGLLRSKSKTTRGKDERDVRYKLLRFAAGRGFEASTASKCLKALGKDGDDSEDDWL